MAEIYSAIYTAIANFISPFTNWLSDILGKGAWVVVKFILGIMEILEFAASSFLGVGSTVDDYYKFAEANNLTAAYTKTFKAICAVAIVLMLIFTILAIVRQEYANATDPSGFSAKNNAKGPIMLKLFKGIMAIIALPIVMIFIISGVNSVLTSFRNAMRGDNPNMTVAASILYSASYDANKYRTYANEDKRVPVTINAYDASEYGPDEQEELLYKIQSFEVQNKLKQTQNILGNTGNCLSFEESLEFKNNKLVNNIEYGDHYETYLCTPEQYKILAEFTDYAQKTQSKYVIVPMDHEAIEWKYVDSAVYSEKDKSLTVTYQDASDLNPDGDIYTITYSMSYEVTSPISNAVDTLKALLGVEVEDEEFKNPMYNEMERDENSVNVVQWANEKVSIHFSADFHLNKPNLWTSTDEIILYEYYHYATNNTFSDYSLDDFSYKKAVSDGDPVILDAYKYVYREYYAASDSYSPEREVPCVLINGNYYEIVKSQDEKDAYGDYLYVLREYEDGVTFLERKYTSIYENTRDTIANKAVDVPINASDYPDIVAGQAYNSEYAYLVNQDALIKFSSGFDLNTPTSWTYTDQIIIYEYFKDLSYRNSLSKYTVADFKEGVRLPTYTITDHATMQEISGSSSKVYCLINDVYYEVKPRSLEKSEIYNHGISVNQIDEIGNPLYELCAPTSDDSDQMLQEIQETTLAFLKYELDLDESGDFFGKYFGISTNTTGKKTPEDFIISYKGSGDDKCFYKGTGISQEGHKYFYKYDNTNILNGTQDHPDVIMFQNIDQAFEEDLSVDKFADFDLKFSATFDYKDVGTWSYRDYFIFYLYVKYLSYSGNISLDQLRTDKGLPGKIGRVGITGTVTDNQNDGEITEFIYVFKIDPSVTVYTELVDNPTPTEPYNKIPNSVYILMDDILNISEKNIRTEFNLDATFNANDYNITSSEDFIISTTSADFVYSTLHTETESKEFKFSSTFCGRGSGSNGYTRVEDWTMGDYLLLALDELGYIDINSKVGNDLLTAKFEKFIYNAVVYKIPVSSLKMDYYTSNEVGDGYIRFYCFGNGDNKVFINENYVTRKVGSNGLGFESFDIFLETKVMSYFSDRLGTTGIITDKDSIASNLYQSSDFSGYVYSISSLIGKLVDGYVYNTSSPMFKIYSDVASYSYRNSDFELDDLTTWTRLDFILYYLEGTVTSKTYRFNIIQDADGNRYCKINDNYAISIESGSPLALNNADNKLEESYTIKSPLSSKTTAAEAASHFSDDDVNALVKKVDPKELIITNPIKYSYKFKGDASKYTVFDMLLIKVQNYFSLPNDYYSSAKYNTTKEFEVYNLKNLTDRYIKLGESDGKYLLLKINSEDTSIFECESKTSITLKTGTVFDYSTEYTPFETLDEDSLNRKHSLLDAIIYHYTYDATYNADNKYKVFKFKWPNVSTDRYYLALSDRSSKLRLIEYNSSTYTKIDHMIDNTNVDVVYGEEPIVDRLYSNFYSDYVIKKDAMSGLLSSNLKIDLVDIVFTDYSSSWSPLNIILYKNGLVTKDVPSSVTSVTESARLEISNTGTRYYIYVEKVTELSKKEFYIDITDFIDVRLKTKEYQAVTGDDLITAITTPAEGEEYRFTSKVTALDTMFLNAALVNGDEIVQDKVDKIVNIKEVTQVKNDIETTYNLSNQKIITNTQNVMTLNDISTWTWFDVLYYYLFNTTNTTTTYERYYTKGASYVKISDGTSGGKNYYLAFDDGADDALRCSEDNKFSAATTKYVSFDIKNIASITKIGIVFNKLTSQTDGNVFAHTIPNSSGDNNEIFVIPSGASSYYIYGFKFDDSVSTNAASGIDANQYYYYKSSAITTNVHEWTTLDYLIRTRFGSSEKYEKVYKGKIITVGGIDFYNLIYEDNSDTFINLNKLGFSLENTATNKIVTSTDSNVDSTLICGQKIMDFVGLDTSKQNSYSYDNKNVFISFDDVSNPSIVSRKSDKFIKLGFSKGFDLNDNTTWKFSDFLLKFIFDDTEKLNYNKALSSDFSYYVDLGYVPATIYDLTYSNGTSQKALLIGRSEELTINPADVGSYYFITKEKYEEFEENNYLAIAVQYDTNKEDGVLEVNDLSFFCNTVNTSKVGMDMALQFKFSANFDFSDISTWTLSDYLIYYIFQKSHTGYEVDRKLNFDHDITNLQYYVNQGYVPARVYYLNKYNNDEKGNLNEYKVLVIGTDEEILLDGPNQTNKDKYIFVNYDLVYELYSKPLYYVEFDHEAEMPLKINKFGQSIDVSEQQLITNFGVKFDVTVKSTDLIYDNNYYFKIIKNLFTEYPDLVVPQNKIEEILSGTSSSSNKYVNLKLHKGFSLDKIDEWTILDYIIIYEFSRNVNNNVFYGLEYNDILNSNLLVQLNGYILKLNGNFYNLEAFNVSDERANEVKITQTLGTNVVRAVDITSSTDNGYSFKVLQGVKKYNLKTNRNEIIQKLLKDAKTLKYEGKVHVALNGGIVGGVTQSENLDKINISGLDMKIDSDLYDEITDYLRVQVPLTIYRKLDSEMYMQFQISLTRYDNYKISPIVKKVNWPQKLMNDMKVIYPDLNWSNLIATDGWIDNLGEYHSGTTSGQYVEFGNSANITAVGMVLSEFFLSVAKDTDTGYSYANYEYESVFDESTIKALMLAMLGEYEYKALEMEAKVFVDLFNTGFAAILDDVAAERGIKIKEGDTSNLAISVYKSYLATAILSSDLGEYLYTVATRVYAQYTIYEAFAKAKGCYADYYAYIHGQSDESGNIVDAFSYASFIELVQYENRYINDGDIPMFTFNMKSVIKKLYATEDTTNDQLNNEVAAVLYGQGISSMGLSFKKVLNDYNSLCSTVYLSNPLVNEKIASNEEYYCFMFDVYWSIKRDLTFRGTKDPIYLKIYRDYLFGDIARWGAFDEVSISGASMYIPNYNLYKTALVLKQIKVTGSLIGCYGVVYNQSKSFEQLSDDERNDLEAQLKQALENAETFIDSFQMTPDVLRKVFAEYSDVGIPGNSECYEYVGDLFPKSLTFIFNSLIVMKNSQEGDMNCWNTIKENYRKAGEILSELSKVKKLAETETTEKGSSKYAVTDSALDSVYSKVQGYYNSLGEYINNQQIIDKIEKTSITFTLGQYGNNFIEEGYEFSIDNKKYQMNTSTSAQRLAEYVYGGSFLVNFGIMPTFTSADFEGIIEVSTVFDEVDGYAKKKLDIFSTVRQFARKMADYTGKLYYLTNLNDIGGVTREKIAGTTNKYNYDYDIPNDSLLLTDVTQMESPNLEMENVYLMNDDLLEDSNSVVLNSLSDRAYITTTPEYIILDHIIKNEYLSYDTIYSILVVDNEKSDTDDSYYNSITGDELLTRLYYNDFSDVRLDCVDKAKNLALRRYLYYIQAVNDTDVAIYDGIYADNPEYLSWITDSYYLDEDVPDENAIINTYESTYSNIFELDYNNIASNSGYTYLNSRTHAVFKKFMLYISGFVDVDTINLEQKEDDEADVLTIDFKQMNFKQLKTTMMDALVEYIQYENSSGEENTNRYLTILYLVSSEFDYYTAPLGTKYEGKDSKILSESQIGRMITSFNEVTVNETLKNIDIEIIKNEDENDCVQLMANERKVRFSADTTYYKAFNKEYSMRTRFRVDSTTKGMILSLAGIPNRPLEELVNLEYNELYDRSGIYDEAYGDTFIYCTYDETTGYYYPVLATGEGYSSIYPVTDFENRIKIYRDLHDPNSYRTYTDEQKITAVNGVVFETEFYDGAYAYPVIARGIVVGNLPTSIKMVDGNVVYYRDGVTATGSLDESSMKQASVTSEITTVGYTKYVPNTAFVAATNDTANQKMMYSGANGNTLSIETAASATLVQHRIEYNYTDEGENGEISVYDNFQTLYQIAAKDSRVFTLLIMLQATVVIPIMFKVLLVAMRRILDIMFLILAGPLVISMNSLEFRLSEGNVKDHRAYTEWKQKLTAALLSAFGLVVSFNLYGILVGTAMNMTYVTAGDATMQVIESNPALVVALKIINGGATLLSGTGSEYHVYVNFIIKFFFVLAGTQMIQSGANLVGNLVTAGKVKTSFNSQLDNKDVFKQVVGIFKGAMAGASLAFQAYTGEIVDTFIHAALEKATEAIPGSAILKKGIRIAQNQKVKKKCNEFSEMAQKHNVSKEVADKMAKELYEEKKKQMDLKRQQHQQKAQSFSTSMGAFSNPSDYLKNRSSQRKDKKKASQKAFESRAHTTNNMKKRQQEEKDKKEGKKPKQEESEKKDSKEKK